MRTICVTILLSVFMAGSVPAQGTYNFRHVGIEDGLSQGSVYHMLKDSHGYLWLSSQDGVNKFNGNKFEVYLSGSSGESTNVQGIAEDVDGTVWIGSHKGIFKYERKKNKFEKIAYTGLPVSSSIHVFADANKNIFFLCETGLYALTTGHSLITF
jgi:ligand-binding sensor domain-containing protein